MKYCKNVFCLIIVFFFCIFLSNFQSTRGTPSPVSCSHREKDFKQTALRHEQRTPPSPQHHHEAEERAQHQAAVTILLKKANSPSDFKAPSSSSS